MGGEYGEDKEKGKGRNGEYPGAVMCVKRGLSSRRVG
jgi:hypothetical protein